MREDHVRAQRRVQRRRRLGAPPAHRRGRRGDDEQAEGGHRVHRFGEPAEDAEGAAEEEGSERERAERHRAAGARKPPRRHGARREDARGEQQEPVRLAARGVVERLEDEDGSRDDARERRGVVREGGDPERGRRNVEERAGAAARHRPRMLRTTVRRGRSSEVPRRGVVLARGGERGRRGRRGGRLDCASGDTARATREVRGRDARACRGEERARHGV